MKSGRRLLVSVVVGALALAGSAPAAHAWTNPLAARGMWIWELSASNGGELTSIVARARQYGVSTLMIKAGDGTASWSQFNSSLVGTLHAYGLRACAWQYVYGARPITEAYVGAAAVRAGADCLIVDAEGEYQGRYVQAQSYIRRLRALIGYSYPVALAGLPYVDYHPGFPYSVFLGPGGAQFNVPQMYWLQIGTTVDNVYAHTYVFNTLYQRPIFPLGQVYDHPRTGQVLRFRQLSRAYGSANVSWWDWQEAPPASWRAISMPVGSFALSTDTVLATVGQGAVGDLVVWAQEHLISAGYPLTIDGGYGPQTVAAVAAFQAANGLLATGVLDTTTWQSLLRYRTTRVTWVGQGRRRAALPAAAGAVMTVPASARLPARRNEIPPIGRGESAGS